MNFSYLLKSLPCFLCQWTLGHTTENEVIHVKVISYCKKGLYKCKVFEKCMAYLIRDQRDPGQFSPAYFAQSKYMVICGPGK